MFPVNSTSVETDRIKRVIAVTQRRPWISSFITSAGVYVCKFTAGTTLYSAHAFGDAVDFMAPAERLEAIANRVVADAEGRTFANLGKPTKAVFVIYKDRQWVKGKGWSHYDGVFHGTHVHVGCSFSTTVKPPCAGG
jgi:hypothetical protein